MRVAENLVVYKKNNEAVFWNTKKGRYLHLYKGVQELEEYLGSFKEENLSNCDEEQKKLLEVLSFHDILVEKEEDDSESMPTLAFEGSFVNEMDLRIEIGKSIDSPLLLEIIEKQAEKLRERGRLKLIFHGLKETSPWTSLIKLIQRIDTMNCTVNLVTFAPCIECDILDIPDDMEKYLSYHEIHLRANYPMPAGLSRKVTDSKRDKKIESLLEKQVYLTLVTEITSDNVNEMIQIAQHHTALTRGAAFDFPPVNPVLSDKKYLAPEMLLKPEVYAKQLADLYKLKLIDNDLFVTIRDICIRVMRIRNSITCSPVPGAFGFVNKSGSFYPCKLSALQHNNHKHYLDINKEINSKSCLSIEGCQQCKLHPTCGGLCANIYEHWRGHHPPYIVDYLFESYCKTRQEIIKAIIWEITT